MSSSDWAQLGATIGKSAKQCRERWCNVLDPSLVNLRAKWSDEEIELLFEAHRTLGSKWSKIAAMYFKGRFGRSLTLFHVIVCLWCM